MNENTQVVSYDQQNVMPTILPNDDKKALYNAMQDSKPIAELTGKKFKVEGFFPEQVLVPKKINVNGKLVDDESGELVERTRLTVFTDHGVFHSHSITFNKAMLKILNMFGAEYKDQTYVFKSQTKGTKVFYVVNIV